MTPAARSSPSPAGGASAARGAGWVVMVARRLSVWGARAGGRGAGGGAGGWASGREAGRGWVWFIYSGEGGGRPAWWGWGPRGSQAEGIGDVEWAPPSASVSPTARGLEEEEGGHVGHGDAAALALAGLAWLCLASALAGFLIRCWIRCVKH